MHAMNHYQKVSSVAVVLAAGCLSGCGDSSEKRAIVQYLDKQTEFEKGLIASDKQSAIQVEQLRAELAAVCKQLDELKKQNEVPHNTDSVKSVDGAIQISTSTDPQVRSSICKVLARLGGEAAERRLVQIAGQDGESSVRCDALEALNAMDSKAVLQLAPTRLESSSYDERQKAAEIMEKQPCEAFRIPALTALAKDCPPDNDSMQRVRQSLYEVICAVGKPEDLPILQMAWEKEMHEDTRRQALNAIISVAAPENYETVLEILAGSTGARELDPVALAKLEKVADIRLTPILLKWYKGSERHARGSIIRLFAKLKDPLAAPVLVENFKNNDDIRRALLPAFAAGYPGIIMTNPEQCALVPEAEMKKLLDERAQKLQLLQNKKPK
jgi:HEAT repeat protein